MSNLQITADATVTADTFLAAAAAGKVRFHTVRSNGTTRRVQFYAEGTKAREEAKWVAAQREAGRTMKEIADELHLSVPSVRRVLNALLLAEKVEAYEAAEIAKLLGTEVHEVVGSAEEGFACTCGKQFAHKTANLAKGNAARHAKAANAKEAAKAE